MPRKCSICTHPKREEIETDILNNVPYRAIATKYSVNRESVRRHTENGHIQEKLIKASEAKEIAQAGKIAEVLGEVLQDLRRIGESAKEKGDDNTEMRVGDRKMKWAEVMGRITGLLKDMEVNVGVQVNIDYNNEAGKVIDFIKKHRLYQKFVKYMQGEYDAERAG